MGRHRPHWRCVLCGTRRVPANGAICEESVYPLPHVVWMNVLLGAVREDVN
jgi:hypothetical protein